MRLHMEEFAICYLTHHPQLRVPLTEQIYTYKGSSGPHRDCLAPIFTLQQPASDMTRWNVAMQADARIQATRKQDAGLNLKRKHEWHGCGNRDKRG